MAKLKWLTAICLSIFLVTTFSSSILATPELSPTTSSPAEFIKSPCAPASELSDKLNKNPKVIHSKTIEDANIKSDFNYKPTDTKSDEFKTISNQRSYTLKELSDMSYDDMLNVMVTLQWNDITGLFTYSEDAQTFFGDANRVKYIINALENRASSFTSTDDKGIPTIVEVLRAAYYLGYYNKGLAYLNTKDFKDLCLPALTAMMDNPNFKFGNPTQDGIIRSFGGLIGNASCNADIANRSTSLLREYRLKLNEYGKDSSKGNAIYSVMHGISYAFTSVAYGKAPETMPYYGKINSYINELKEIALINNNDEVNQWFINNGIYYLGDLGVFHSDSTMATKVLTTIMDTSEKYSEKFYIAAQRIYYIYNGKDSHGETINYRQLQEEGSIKYLPKEYVFDDGSIVIHVGSNVSAEKIQRLYWAAKEVESQFFRVVGNDTALDKNGNDDVLTIKIFNSPKEYDMNRYLSGLDTNNGGIYIESTGTFYTYERTTEESIYSLEELFRHEFTHYLQGRYLVPGLWGEGEFYSNDDLVWFEEGSAEFFAGSTRTEGIKPRLSIVNLLSQDESEMYTLNRLFSSNYNSGWDFYNYGFAFVSYMYTHDMNAFNKINTSVMNKDITAYRNTLTGLKNNSTTNESYKEYIKDLIKNKEDLTTPLVSDEYIKTHKTKSLASIINDIATITGIKDIRNKTFNSSNFKIFEISGEYTGNTSHGKLQDFSEMNNTANKILKDLSSLEWSGYNTVTCYFTDYKVVNGNYKYKLVFRGLLNDSSIPVENNAPTAYIDAPSKGNVNEEIQFNSDKSSDLDGFIVSQKWDFGDNSVSSSQNPIHKYVEPGIYTVTLTVTDNKGATGVASSEIIIIKTDDGTTGSITREIEPNNTFDKANEFIGNNVSVDGTIENIDDTDIFAFEVDKPGEVNINFTCDSSPIAWTVYNENDLDNILCWEQYKNGDVGSGSFNASAGKYYLVVYGFNDSISNLNYTININGIKEYSNVPEIDIIKEQEPNNYYNSLK